MFTYGNYDSRVQRLRSTFVHGTVRRGLLFIFFRRIYAYRV